MQETCVLNFLPVIPQWKIYNLPSKSQVQYSLILKQKKELQSLVVSALHSRQLKIFSCTIIDKRVCFPKKNKIIEIVFLNQVLSHNLLALKLSVNENYVAKRLNNFLVFIKNIHKKVRYQVQNDCIYVKCDNEVQWDIFYNLFKFLLVRNRMSIIGSAFYDSFVCIFMMKNEKDACIFLSANNDLQVPLCEKHELNPSRSKSVNAQNRYLKSNIFHRDNCASHEINLFSSSQHSFSELTNIRMKRKLVINENDDLASVKKAQKVGHCFCEKISCKCHGAKWKIFRNISKYSVSNYLDILLSKEVLSDEELCSTQENKSFTILKSSPALQTIKDSLSDKNFKSSVNLITDEYFKEETKEICENDISPNKNVHQNSDQQLVAVSTKENSNSNQVETLKEKKTENVIDTPVISVNKSEFGCYQNRNVKEKSNDYFTCDNFFEFRNDPDEAELGMFHTAAGKKVIVSETALQQAKNMFAEVFQPDNTTVAENKSLKLEKLKLPVNEQCSTKIITDDYIEENIDKALAEKIFEEISFDDKESEGSSNILSFQSPSVCTEKTLNNVPSFGKVRKSLGGRRSLKPYST